MNRSVRERKVHVIFIIAISFLLLQFPVIPDAIFSMFPSIAFADGILIVDYPRNAVLPRPLPSNELPPPEPLAVRYHRVTVELTDAVGKTSIDQVFKNEQNVELEGMYIFPLPESASISEFAMWMDGRRGEGEILEKDKARSIYEDIVRRRRDPALLEYIGTNLFKARVYPVPALGEKRIELSYSEILKYDSGIYVYRYPLNTEKFSSKPLEEVTVFVRIKSSKPVKSVYSPSHRIDVVRVDEHNIKVSYEEKGVKPDRDFIIYYTVSDQELAINLLCHKEEKNDGYFMLIIAPGNEISNEKKLPKDIAFVIDTSGSMLGRKLEQVRNALKFCLLNLDPDDRFNIINFATEASKFESQLVAASKENIDRAVAYVEKLRAIGGTNINSALLEALKLKKTKDERPFFIVFLTDGIPTVEETDVNRILANIEDANKETAARIFVFGAGDELNTLLLDKLAGTHHGTIEYVLPDEDIEVKISNFYTKIASPVLTDISLDFGNVSVSGVYPQKLPDLFKGTELLVLGRYREGKTAAITLKGKIGNQEKKIVNDVNFLKATQENDFLPRLWAQKRIGYLLEQIRLKGEEKELKDEIIALSKEHGIITPYTSFLVLEDEERAGRPSVQITGSSSRPDGREDGKMIISAPVVERSGGGMEAREAFDNVRSFAVPEASVKLKTEMEGASAVRMSRAINRLVESRRAISFDRIVPASMKYAGNETFIAHDNEWWVSSYEKGRPLIEIKAFSDALFELLRRWPRAGKYVAVGQTVIFELDGKFFRVGDRGIEKVEELERVIGK